MSTINFIALILGLILKIWDEIASAKAIAKAEKKEFDLNKKTFLELAEKAFLKMRDEVKKDNAKIGDLEGRIDQGREF